MPLGTSPPGTGINQTDFLNFLMRCGQIVNAAEFETLIRQEFYLLMPHEIMVCGIGGVSPKGSYIHKVLNMGYPVDYFFELVQSDGRVDSPLMREWRDKQAPVYFQSGRDKDRYPEAWVEIFDRYELRNTISHGIPDVQGTISSYFIFSRIPGEVSEEHALILKLATPHLHLALVRALATVADVGEFAGAIHLLLSQRQREILHWLHEGKTNWEIAKILDMTEKNVKYHVEQILAKLEVRNRTQAVAKAVSLGLLVEPPAT